MCLCEGVLDVLPTTFVPFPTTCPIVAPLVVFGVHLTHPLSLVLLPGGSGWVGSAAHGAPRCSFPQLYLWPCFSSGCWLDCSHSLYAASEQFPPPGDDHQGHGIYWSGDQHMICPCQCHVAAGLCSIWEKKTLHYPLGVLSFSISAVWRFRWAPEVVMEWSTGAPMFCIRAGAIEREGWGGN